MISEKIKRLACLGALFSLFALGGCDLAAAKVDDTPYLEALGFNKPIETSVYVWQPPGDDAKFPNNQNTLFLSGLVASNDIAIVPNAGSAPWWGYGALPGRRDGQNLIITLGEREITGRSEQRQWKEGPREFFAETITYIVKKAEHLKAVGTAEYGPFTLRLVLVNDPAVGHWQVETGQLNPQLEMQAVVQQISANTQALFSQLSEKISAARQAAFTSIEHGLSASGTLERSASDRFVLISKKNKLAYYIKPNAFHITTMNEMISYCRSVSTTDQHAWHVPNTNEMKLLMAWDEGRSRGEFIDVPDGRLLGAIALPSPEAHTAYTASPWSTNEAFSFVTSPAIEGRDTFGGSKAFFVPIYWVDHAGTGITLNSVELSLFNPHDGRQIYGPSQVNDISFSHPFAKRLNDLRVICVANL